METRHSFLLLPEYRVSVPWQPTKSFKQYVHILPPEPGGCCPLILQSLPLTAPGCSLCCWGQPCVALHGRQCLLFLVCEYMWLTNCCQSHLSSVRCQGFSHLITLGQESPSLPKVELVLFIKTTEEQVYSRNLVSKLRHMVNPVRTFVQGNLYW